MLDYMTIGANNVEASARFYDVLLLPLGYEKDVGEGYAVYSLKDIADRDNGPGTIYVMKPFDGGTATPGNGMMPAFRVPDDVGVRKLHAAGMASGGSDEGAPGTRSYYTPNFYVGYLRDPVGNKVALFTVLDSR